MEQNKDSAISTKNELAPPLGYKNIVRQIKNIHLDFSRSPRLHPYAVEIETPAGDEMWLIDGECNLCGSCCRKLGCTKFRDETRNGRQESPCKIYHDRPARCAIFPVDPYEPLPVDCGFSFVKVG